MGRMSVKEAARLTGMTERFIRKGLQDGRFAWGYAVKFKRWSYYINAEKFGRKEL